MIDLDSLTETFTQASVNAAGYQTAFHAGTAAVMRQIAGHLLSERFRGPERLREELIRMVRAGEPQ